MSKTRVAVLVDIENAQPVVLDNAMRIAASLGRVTIRRGYGNQAKLNQWSDTLQRHGFAPCMQFQYVGGKNTADIELALDALEMLLDQRVDHFLIVSSDSDFVGLCRKLQERGGVVQIVGEAKTPAALRQACDKFHEHPLTAPSAAPATPAAAAQKPIARQAPKDVMKTIRKLVQAAPDGLIHMSTLGQQVPAKHPGLSYSAYGYKNLRSMLESCNEFRIHQMAEGHCLVSLATGSVPTPSATLQLVG